MDCLVYVDPSQRGEWALRLARQLPPALAPRLVVLATEEDLAEDPGLLERARAVLGAPGRGLEERRGRGPAERAIAAEARSRRYGLVVVPPAGRNALQRMLKGSRVARVVHSIGTSVLVARRPPDRLERILAAVSGGKQSGPVTRAALELGQALGAKVGFFHVVDEVALPYEPAAGAGLPPAEDSTALARAALGERGRELTVREGLVVEEVMAEVEHGAHDLLVIGSAADPARWGSEDVTERLLLSCPTSILVVRD
jgi:nucleotide-binding universal stress UspA family protein